MQFLTLTVSLLATLATASPFALAPADAAPATIAAREAIPETVSTLSTGRRPRP